MSQEDPVNNRRPGAIEVARFEAMFGDEHTRLAQIEALKVYAARDTPDAQDAIDALKDLGINAERPD